MRVFSLMSDKDHEQVLYCHDKKSGLKAIVAIHDTTLGPALGGCRFWHYGSEEEALCDALRLSRGMTYKAAVAGLNLGGGKTVIMAQPGEPKTEKMFRALGRFINDLGGRYITAEDVGTTTDDMTWVHMETPYVTGLAPRLGGLGDPSPVTALGVFHGLRAALFHCIGHDHVEGRTVAVQGLGQVGTHLIGHLLAAGAHIIACDTDDEKIKRAHLRYPHIRIVPPAEIYDVACDIFAPCALGGTINDHSIPRLRCQFIAGSANNVLQDEERDSNLLREKKIVYVPDFVISAGGLISVANELAHHKRKDALAQTSHIFSAVEQVLSTADKEHITTHSAALRLAERRIASIGALRRR